MNKQRDLLGIFLSGTTGVALLALILVRTFFPRIILPTADASTVILFTLAALLLDYYLARGSRRDYRLIPLYGALIFGLFPLAACMTSPMDSLKSALLGTVIFTVTTYLFDTIIHRLSDTSVAKIAPLFGALGLYLAVQGLAGIV